MVKLIKHPSEEVVQESYKKARELYILAKKERLPPITYHIKNSYLTYSSLDNFGIAKGTCFPEVVFPNFYRVDQRVNGKHITTYRCGIIPSVTENDIKHLAKTVSINRPTNKKNNLIVISLVGSCTTRICRFVKTIANTGILPKAATTSLNEDAIIQVEKKVHEILPLFIPLRPQSIRAGPISVSLSKDHQITTRKDLHYKKMADMIDMTNPETVFKSIVNIGAYYYTIKDDYNLLLHCKSNKERSGVTDLVLRATFDCLMTKKHIDYDQIRKNARLFLEPILNIAYFSTGLYGLKIGQLPIAHYVMSDKEVEKISRT